MRKNLKVLAAAMMACLPIMPKASGAAVVVGPASFSPAALTESFEGITPTVGFDDAGNGFIAPIAPQLVHFFPANLLAPKPNPGLAGGVVIADWANGAPQIDLGANGQTGIAAIPNGTAHLAMVGTGSWTIGIVLTACECNAQVGFVWTAQSPTVDFHFTFVDAPPLDLTLPSVPVLQWESNFLGVFHRLNILSVAVTGTNVVIDQLQIEHRVASEPSGLMLILGALVGSVLLRRSALSLAPGGNG